MNRIYRAIAVLLLIVPVAAHAVLRIEINQSGGIQDRTPIAVVPFDLSGVSLPVNPTDVISADLTRSGLFELLPESRLLSNPATAAEIEFNNWRSTDTEYVLVGKVESAGGQDLRVRAELVDIVRQERILANSYTIVPSQLRRLAHVVADQVYEKILGTPGVFDTRFAYVTTAGSASDRIYSLQLADIDGENITSVLRIARPIMSPAWSSDGRQLAYVSFEFPGRTAIVVHNLASAERRKLVSTDGINGAPAWSPDGSRLAVSLSHRGSPDIYVVNVNSGQMFQFTNESSIETEPEWLDNDNIVFTSNRSGTPQIYVQNLAAGADAQRLTFEGDYNAAAAASPDGSSIAFIHREEGGYRIAVMDIQSRVLTVLTDGRLDESPSFAPNGEMILYATQEGGRELLGVVSTDGLVSQRISLADEGVRDPAWGPMR